MPRLRSRWTIRAVFSALLVLTAATVVGSFVASGVDSPGGPVAVEEQFAAARDHQLPSEHWSTARVRAATAGQRNVTVVATQGFSISDERAELAAFTANGTIIYYEDRYRSYFDVDPVQGTRYTVEVVAANHLTGADCAAFDRDRCTRNLVVRINLTTGERERVYSALTPRIYNSRWHDVDRLDAHHLVVADISGDGVYAVDTRTGNVTWEWHAERRWSHAAGGPSTDWTHINDVSVLPDGRIMVSVRNMDSVVFLSVENGTAHVQRNWTLGSDDAHDVLFEQHNPDYIPADRGGPAILLADSENTRVEEYHRVDGQWVRAWRWRDVRLQWPRDADRLPGGNTLVVDSHGDRVLEVAPNGGVQWAAHVALPYDVERLGTGDESATGRARQSRDHGGRRIVSPVNRIWLTLKDLVPPVETNSLLYLAPSWVRFADLVFGVAFVSTGLVWGSCELYWSRHSLVSVAGDGLTALGTTARSFGRRLL
ncbi:MAG: aryl-sulfate sulfotransferase [Haloarculaceae archaeon]